uniref:Uncharacterized protein n=1 Tax=Rhizophora mucronata TaxID=61149 RepID=A0A2P2R2U2_RHIMU
MMLNNTPKETLFTLFQAVTFL